MKQFLIDNPGIFILGFIILLTITFIVLHINETNHRKKIAEQEKRDERRKEHFKKVKEFNSSQTNNPPHFPLIGRARDPVTSSSASPNSGGISTNQILATSILLSGNSEDNHRADNSSSNCSDSRSSASTDSSSSSSSCSSSSSSCSSSSCSSSSSSSSD